MGGGCCARRRALSEAVSGDTPCIAWRNKADASPALASAGSSGKGVAGLSVDPIGDFLSRRFMADLHIRLL